MNESLSLLACDHPGRRILEWLEQCSAYPKNKEAFIVDSEANADNVSHFISNIQGENDLGEQRQNKNISTASKNICSKTRHRRSSESDSGCLTSSTAWRTYSLEENQQIIKYIIDKDAFPFIKGTLLWQKMEKERVCYRSWQSMRSQFITKIYPHLGTYSLEVIDKEKFMECMKPSTQTKFIHMEPGQRGWRKNGKYYTVEEDIVILKYISQRRRYLKVLGNSIWQTMEDKHVLSGRSWQSMRSRYLNVIRHSLDKYELKKHGVEVLVNLKRNGLSDNKQNSACEESQSLKTTENTTTRNKRNQLRKDAISASIQLASNLNLYGKTSQSEKCADNEIPHMVTTLPHNEIPDSQAQAFVGDNTSERNSRIDEASENDIEDAFTCGSVGPNFQNSSVEPPDVSLSQSCDGTHQFVENNSSKGNSENLDINVECSPSFGLPNVPNLQECTLAASAMPILIHCDGVNTTIVDFENNTFAAGNTVENNDSTTKKLGNEDSMLQTSIFSAETVRFDQEALLRSYFMIQNCKECFNNHKLSPSSN